MRGYRFHWLRHTPFQLKNLTELYPHKILEDIKHEGFVNLTVPDLLITMLFGLQLQSIRSDLLPKALAIKWFQPFNNVVNRLKNHNALILQNLKNKMQISAPKAGDL